MPESKQASYFLLFVKVRKNPIKNPFFFALPPVKGARFFSKFCVKILCQIQFALNRYQ